ncbi:unnamed protein product [Medioppia subpectinata]|nr:unnamed protein product [Medioppia subpectinata]CAG2100712.1 unnamed protein product [Medioppia subpectinata]
MEEFNASLRFDKRLYSADITGSIAYAKALRKCDLLKENELNLIEEGLENIRSEWQTGMFVIKGGDEDIHTANERRLKELIGADIGGKLHTGRSRNDQVSTDMKIWLRDSLKELLKYMLKLIEVIIKRSLQYTDAIMPGYTHLQRAQPVYFSHWLLSFAFMYQQDCERLIAALDRMNVCPLGSGAISGNPFNIDRDFLAKELGFKSCSMNSMHAVGDRDFVAEFHFWSSLTVIHFSKMAEDLLLFSTKEFSFIEISDSFSTGSSLMPQKKNADSLELIRGKSGRIVGNLTAILVVLKGIPSTFNKDLQEDKEGMFDSFDTMKSLIQVITGAIDTLTLNRNKCIEALSSDMLATDIAYYLVRKGVSFRKTHELAGSVVSTAERLGLEIHNLPLNVFKEISEHFDEDIRLLWNFENSVNQYTVKGGTSKASVLQQINFLKDWLKDNTE